MLRTIALLIIILLSISHVSHAYQSDRHNNVSHPANMEIQRHLAPLRIAVAANFTPVLKILLADFTKETGIKSQIMSSASGVLYLQIKHGAPFDIFLSADSLRPKMLEKSGLSVKNSRKTYAMGQLAFYSSSVLSPINHSPALSIEQLSLALLKTMPDRFAIANPDIAPYGKAAQEVLQHLALWKPYQSKLVKGTNINQTFTQLRSKTVSSGIVSNSQLVLNHLSGVIIPHRYHQPIEQQLIIMRNSKQQAAAQKLSHFLLSTASQNKIIRYGYTSGLSINNEHNFGNNSDNKSFSELEG